MGESSYYRRAGERHVDGTLLFKKPEDDEAERTVARLVEQRRGCEVRAFGALCAIDWYVMRAERLVGLLELKHRSHSSDRYPTVFLNVRKWLALLLASQGLGVPGVFIVKFTDGVRWINVADVDARHHRIGGCKRRVKSVSDVEPVIEIPVSEMHRFAEG